MDLDDRFQLSELYEEYGCLLTEKQRDALQLYCCMDLSLNEIALQKGVSRQAVRDSLEHARAALADYEDKLGINRFRSQLSSVLDSGEKPELILKKIRLLLED